MPAHTERRSVRGRGPAAGTAALLAVVAAAALSLSGCTEPRHEVRLTPLQERELESRALNLLLTAAESDLDDVSCNAIEALVQVAPREGLSAFRRATRSRSPIVRYAGFAALGDVRDRDSLPALRTSLKDENAHVRLAVAYALCRCGDDKQVGLLRNTLTDVQDENLRADAASLMGRVGDPRAIKHLRAALRYPINSKSVRVSLALNGALAALGDAPALSELINQSQGAPEARSIALLLLADLGKPEAADALRYRLTAVKREYDEARLIAARGLGKLRSAEGYDMAAKMVTWTDPNPKPTADNPDRTFAMRSLAVHALAEIGDRRGLPVLRDAATADNPRLQVAASYAICKIVQLPQ